MGNPNEEKHYGFFRGKVIQNNDPERMGRVKVFIPEFASDLARQLGLEPSVFGARFTGGKNIDTFLDANVLEKLKGVLPWVEQASPLMGGGTSGVYDIKNNIATVGEGHRGAESFEPLGEESISPSGESVPARAGYSVHGTPGLCDTGYKTGLADTYNQSLGPTGLNNASKGSFSVPRVGADVWVFFENGSINKPVYMAYAFDKSDWNSVCNPQDTNPDLHYPGGSENIKGDGDQFYYTGKHVLNSKAGSLEFIETDDLEKIKITHYSGSFLEFGNHITSEVAIQNKTTFVNGDHFHSVKGNSVTRINGDTHLRYEGHVFLTYGDPDKKSYYSEWVEKAAPAFNHAAAFNDKERPIKDPTKDGIAKKNCNNKYSHPKSGEKGDLTLKKDWTKHLKTMSVFKYAKLDQINYLDVKKTE